MTGQWVNQQPEAGGAGDPDDDINLVYNGKFESALIGTAGWTTPGVDGSITRNTTSPISGTADLEVEVTAVGIGGIGTSTQIYFAYGEVVNGDTVTLSLDIKGAGDILIYVEWGDAAPDEDVWTGTLTGAVQEVSEEITIPTGESELTLYIITSWESVTGTTFYIDNVKLVKTASA